MSRAATEVVSTETLFGGVSRRPPHLRLPNQVEDADNALFGVRDGAARRPGTWTIRQLCAPGFSTTDLRIHVIEGDADERYMVIYGQGVLRVLEMATWVEASIVFGPTAQAYVQLNGATASQFRLRSAIEATFILNTTVIAESKASSSYFVTGTWKNYDVMTSATPADGTFHRTTESSAGRPPGYYQYDVDGTTFATARFVEVTGDRATPTGIWNNSAGSPYGFQIRFRKRILTVTAGVWTQATRRLVQAGKFASWEFETGDQINITGGTGVTAGWRDIAAKISDNEIELVSTAGFTVNNADTTANAIGQNHEVLFTTDGNDTAEDMSEIAERIEDALQAKAPDALVSWNSTGYQKGFFVITAPYRGTHAAVFAPAAPSGGTDLTAATFPFEAATVVLTAGTGSGSLTLGIDERWDRTQPPGQAGAFPNEATLPVRLRRTGTNPLAFSVFPIPWVGRFVGDDKTNPLPSLFRSNIAIQDLAFHANRLTFAGGDKVAFGKTGSAKPNPNENSIFDVYKDDPTNPVESDPFQETIGSDELGRADYIAPFRKSLTLFTLAGRQFDLAAPDAVVAAGRVAITPSTRYFTRRVRPIAIDELLYFVASLGCESRLFEYQYDEITVASKADDVSAHVPEYLPEAIRTIQVSANHEMVLLLEDRSDRIFVFRTNTTKDGRRTQAAWSRWSFEHEVLDIAISGNDLFLLVDRSGTLVIERMPLEPETAECPPPVAVGCPTEAPAPPYTPPPPATFVGIGLGLESDPAAIVGRSGGINSNPGGSPSNDPSAGPGNPIGGSSVNVHSGVDAPR